MVLSTMSECERREVTLQIGIAAHRPIVCYNQQPLILRPAHTHNRPFIPWDLPHQLPSAAVDIDCALSRLVCRASRKDLATGTVDSCVRSRGVHVGLVGVHTYSAAIGSPRDYVVLELEVRVEDGGVELCFAVEAVADTLPVRGWL